MPEPVTWIDIPTWIDYIGGIIIGLGVLFGLIWSMVQLGSKLADWHSERVLWREAVTKGMQQIDKCFVALHNHIPTSIKGLEIRLTRIEGGLEHHATRIEGLEHDIDHTLDRVLKILEHEYGTEGIEAAPREPQGSDHHREG